MRVRLLLSFTLVVLVSVIGVVVFARQGTANTVRAFMYRGGMVGSDELVASLQDFYRFGLTCRGEARLDRLIGGEASAPYPPEFSGAVPPGAPSTSRLGVWALGKELRFYANGQLLFTTSDPVLGIGGLGVYARANGEDSVTIDFSDLDVYQAKR